MNVETQHLEKAAQFGWLDAILALVRNIKWLIAVPLIAGFVGYLIATYLPKSYTSTAVIAAPSTSIEASVLTPAILNEVIKTFPGPEQSTDDRRLWLSSKTKLTRFKNISAQPGDRVMMSLQVRDANPETARQIAETLIATWLSTLTPQGTSQEKLKVKLQETQAELASVQNAIKRFENDTSSQGAEALAILYSTRTALRKEAALIIDSLDGTRMDEVIVSRPTLPDVGQNIGPLPALIAALIGAILTFTLTILMANLVHQIGNDPTRIEKWNALRAACGFNRK